MPDDDSVTMRGATIKGIIFAAVVIGLGIHILDLFGLLNTMSFALLVVVALAGVVMGLANEEIRSEEPTETVETT